ncbi:dihydroxy-acid dehydratase [Candidatus Formimonas warabiya]|uniref:Dihydroxy-acid dehydratase n=1 Tax=Formimonas warabiya TaxID=1761012 RepID=A0A3G1KVY9_FORW1|nr:dihydroxy-acid dehydratase [Candidatus Formimonas warabiya]ATW26703.1 dihydroxy-acid dehydratase [Candidatus Formimonas warabiya]
MVNKFWDGPEAAHRRVVYKGAGYSDSDIRNKPHIGIANTYAENSPAHIQMRTLADAVKQGIWEAGGVPVEFGVPSTCGNVAIGTEMMRYELAGRDAVAMSIEFVASVHQFDGMVMLACCDNIIPGTILAAIRKNIPSIVLTGGPMFPGNYQNKPIITPDVNVGVFADTIPEDFCAMEDAACPGIGVCAVMGTANTMQILAEALGLSLPGSATIPAALADRVRAARESGRQAVRLAKEGIRPRDIITKAALDNATTVDLGIGGSSNAVLHILAIAYELGIPYSLDEFDKRNHVPCICGVRSAGPYSVVDLHFAGGVPAVEKILEPYLDTGVRNIAGTILHDVIKDVQPVLGGVLRPLDQPWHTCSGITVLKGNLAQNGAVIRTTGVPENMLKFSGPARVFNSDHESFLAITNGKIKAGDIIVLRYEGVKGSPGMNELMQSTDALVALGLDDSVGLISDGRFSGFNHGPIVGHISPEAMEGGNLAFVEEGDLITVDCFQKELTLHVSDEVLAVRRNHWQKPQPKITKGMMALYAATARPSHEGGAMQNW